MYKELKKVNTRRTSNPANNYMKTCLTSLSISEMQIKTTLRFHLIPVRMAIIKYNNNNSKCWQGSSEKGAIIYFR
jgi:hypothetical protein